jgi:hypothetical protein
MDTARESIGQLHAGDHCCAIYHTEKEYDALSCEFVQQGVERGEKILYLAVLHSVEYLQKKLEAYGIDVEGLLAKGQLSIVTAQDTYLREATFDPDKMIEDVLKPAVAQALAEGYPALRATGEMTWVLTGHPGSERLIEYESKLNDFYGSHRAFGLCQYKRAQFDSEVLIDVLHTHSRALVGTRICDNRKHYYVTEKQFMGSDRPGAVLDQFLSNLAAQ